MKRFYFCIALLVIVSGFTQPALAMEKNTVTLDSIEDFEVCLSSTRSNIESYKKHIELVLKAARKRNKTITEADLARSVSSYRQLLADEYDTYLRTDLMLNRFVRGEKDLNVTLKIRNEKSQDNAGFD